jgi:hypothetical protein
VQEGQSYQERLERSYMTPFELSKVANISTTIFIISLLTVALIFPLISWVYLDKEFKNLRKYFHYKGALSFFMVSPLHFRCAGYMIFLIFKDHSSMRSKNRINNFFSTETPIKEIVNIKTIHRLIAFFCLTTLILMWLSLTLSCILMVLGVPILTLSTT